MMLFRVPRLLFLAWGLYVALPTLGSTSPTSGQSGGTHSSGNIGVALAIRSQTDVAEYKSQNIVRRYKLSAAVYSSNQSGLYTLSAGTCVVAAAHLGANVPADVACGLLLAATFIYALYGHFASEVGTRRFVTLDRPAQNGLSDYVHYFPNTPDISTIERLEQAYNGKDRILVAHHPCQSDGCYNVFYRNYPHNATHKLHHLAIEPRGGWHETSKDLPKGEGKEHNKKVHYKAKKTKLFGDYHFVYGQKKGGKILGHAKGAKKLRLDFLRAAHNQEHDFKTAGHKCLDFEVRHGGATYVATFGTAALAKGHPLKTSKKKTQKFLKECL